MPKKYSEEEEARAHDEWSLPLCDTCFARPSDFCCAFWCGPCFTYNQRKRILNDDLSQYQCCGGICCNNCCESQVKSCPGFCLGLEVICCFWWALSANRWLIQSAYFIKTSIFDRFLITLACICSWVRCILSCFIDIPDSIDLMIDCIYCVFSACLLTQQEAELDKRKGPITQQPGPTQTV
eukprot:Colp12_sorted_trinity150504_noHs@9082